MKKMIMVFAVVSACCGWAATEMVDGITWTYTVSNGEAVIGNGSGAALASQHSGEVSVPSILGNHPVSVVNSKAFRYSNASGVLIPNSVTNVLSSAFEYCSNLTRVEFTNPFTSIYHSYRQGGYNASFYECRSIVDGLLKTTFLKFLQLLKARSETFFTLRGTTISVSELQL